MLPRMFIRLQPVRFRATARERDELKDAVTTLQQKLEDADRTHREKLGDIQNGMPNLQASPGPSCWLTGWLPTRFAHALHQIGQHGTRNWTSSSGSCATGSRTRHGLPPATPRQKYRSSPLVMRPLAKLLKKLDATGYANARRRLPTAVRAHPRKQATTASRHVCPEARRPSVR